MVLGAEPRTIRLCYAFAALRSILLFTGQPYSPELTERAHRATGAREIRTIEPEAPTRSISMPTLNVEVDRAAVVTGLRCG